MLKKTLPALTLLATLLGPTPAHAVVSSTYSLFGRVGLMQDNFMRVSTADSGSKGIIAGPMPALGLSYRIGSFMPGVSYTILGRSAASDTSKAKILAFDLPYIWSFFDSFELKTGAGLMMKSISGDGGTVQLNNGNSTSSFARPGRSVTSTTAFLHLGAGLPYSDAVRFDMDLWVSGAFSSRRAFTLYLSAAWGFL